MKKLLALLLCGVLCLSLCACGNTDRDDDRNDNQKRPSKVLTLDETKTVKDYAAFSLVKVFATKKLTPSVAGFTYYENETDGNVYVDVVLDWKNLCDTPIACDEIAELTAVGAHGIQYECKFYALETTGYSDLNQYANIDPLSTARLHCVLDVPQTESKLDITLKVKRTNYTLTYTMGDTLSNATELQVGDVIEEPDFATLSFLGISYADKVKPTNTDGFYTLYEAESPDSTYLMVRYDVTNRMSDAVGGRSFAGVTAVYMDKYTYDGFAAVEDADGSGFSTYEVIKPLTTRHMYFLIEVPKSVIENEVTLTLFFHGKEYVYTGKV